MDEVVVVYHGLAFLTSFAFSLAPLLDVLFISFDEAVASEQEEEPGSGQGVGRGEVDLAICLFLFIYFTFVLFSF